MDSAVWALLGVFVGFCAAFGVVAARTALETSPDESADFETLLAATEVPIVCCDDEGVIGYSNQAFRRLVGADPCGDSIERTLSELPELHTCVSEGGGTAELSSGDCYDVSVVDSPETDRSLILFHEVSDVGDGHVSEAGKLDQFASLVSHDLRNPLDVAIGRTNAVSELNDDPGLEPHLESTQQALHRMQDIITGVLVVASQGDAVGELSAVKLDDLAEECWEHVDTESATLDIETSVTIEANPEALLHVFENLFRNAIEHGGTDVRVRVGELSEGFFIEDDGPGIPDEQREQFRKPGETGNDHGTGLGLAIVDNITDAHDWNLVVTESENGGARFEFSNVTVANDACAVTNCE